MLRSFEQVSHPHDPATLIAASQEHATISAGGTYAMPWHWHDCLMFILPSEGTVELKHEDRREGTWLSHDRFAVVPTDRAHQTRSGMGGHNHVALYVKDDALHRLDSEVGSLTEFYRRIRTTTLVQRSSALRSLQTLSTRSELGPYGNGQMRDLLSRALLVQCIADVIGGEVMPGASHKEHGVALVEDLKAYLRQHVDEDIALDQLVEQFRISRRHITRLFRDHTGSSIGEFQTQARIDKAKQLLTETDLPVGEIAFRVGFESGAALARAMRRATGRSPSDIRSELARLVKI